MTRLKLGSLLILPALLGACASATAITVTPLCGETAAKAPIKPVCINKDDALTEKTASQIEGNNLALTKLCKVKVDCRKKKPTT